MQTDGYNYYCKVMLKQDWSQSSLQQRGRDCVVPSLTVITTSLHQFQFQPVNISANNCISRQLTDSPQHAQPSPAATSPAFTSYLAIDIPTYWQVDSSRAHSLTASCSSRRHQHLHCIHHSTASILLDLTWRALHTINSPTIDHTQRN